ncbi:MAG: exodeoxyribonuclease VII large subunit, partial [Deltaproteobacteria bacterium]|nr:exodeoxyribonuclease VII large subunit [Deltaproteobacteria bacterium]
MPSLLSDLKTYSPSQVSELITSTLRRQLGPINLVGEVSSISRPNSGHVYLEIKDKKAMIKGVVWFSHKRTSGIMAIEAGMMIQAKGHLQTYGARSEYQLSIEKILPLGEGALSLAFEKLKKK